MIIHAAFHALLDNTADMVFIKDSSLKYVAASLPFVRMVGKESVSDIVRKSDYDLFEDQDLAKRYVSDDRKLLAGGVDLENYVEPITEEKGRPRYGSTSKYILRGADGNILGILGITKDITLNYITRQAYQQELSYLFTLPKDTYAVAYMDVDDWRIISQRRQHIQSSTLQSCSTVEELCATAVASMVDPHCEAAEFYKNFTSDALNEIFKTGKTMLSFQYQRRFPDNSIRWVQNDIRFLNDADRGNFCAMLSARDIHPQKQKEYALELAAKTDKMTQLLNRETTMESISQTLKEAPDQLHALLMIDIDNFKVLNDTLGHQAGDQFLVSLAAVLRSCFRSQDIKGRIGGDEFFILMKNISDPSVVSQKAQELLSCIHQLSQAYPNVGLSGSIGISLYPRNSRTLENLYFDADTALYQAKRSGKSKFVISSH